MCTEGTGSQAAWEAEMQRLGKAIEAWGWSQGYPENLFGERQSMAIKKQKRLMTARLTFHMHEKLLQENDH